ncbi:uncharacterized protein LOC102550560 [Rattus norvegicus]
MEQAGSPEQKVTQGVRGKVAANAKLDLDHEESVTSVTYTFGFNLDHEEPRNVLRTPRLCDLRGSMLCPSEQSNSLQLAPVSAAVSIPLARLMDLWKPWTASELDFPYLRSPAPQLLLAAALGGCSGAGLAGGPAAGSRRLPAELHGPRPEHPAPAPGACPGSAARLPPGPGVPLGPSARRPGRGPLCSLHVLRGGGGGGESRESTSGKAVQPWVRRKRSSVPKPGCAKKGAGSRRIPRRQMLESAARAECTSVAERFAPCTCGIECACRSAFLISQEMDSLLAMPLQAFPFIKTQLGSAVVSNSAIEDTACRS